MKENFEVFKYSLGCYESSIGEDNHDSSHHHEVSYDHIQSILRTNVECFSYKPFLEAQKSLVKELHNVKYRVTELIKVLDKNLTRIKLSHVMNLKDPKILTSLAAIVNDDTLKIRKITCFEMRNIVNLMERNNFSEKHGEQKLMKKLWKLNEKISDQLCDIVHDFCEKSAQNMEKMAENRPFLRKNSRKAREKSFHHDYGFDEDNSYALNQPESDDQFLMRQFLKIEDLKHYPVETLFNIRLKIERIVKEFPMAGTKNVEFLAGDEGGVAVCVMRVNPLIRVGNVIEFINSRIYIFQKKIKQIQTSNSSILIKCDSSMVDFVNMDHNFTQESEKQLKDTNHYDKKHSDSKSEGQEQYDKEQELSDDDDGFVSGLEFKIENFNPSSKDVTFIAKVIEVHLKNHKFCCLLGDSTGIIEAELPDSLTFLSEGLTIKLNEAYAAFRDKKLKVMVSEKGFVTSIDDTEMKLDFYKNFSDVKWEGNTIKDSESDEEEILEDF